MNKPNIVIVDYGMGNIRSVHNALVRMGGKVITSQEPRLIEKADALVLPGVGAFGEAMSNLASLNLINPIINAAKKEAKPLLGICLGMQLLADSSEERGVSKGLSLIDGHVELISVSSDFRLPHIGWNSISICNKEPLFNHLQDDDCFYFVHSFQFNCNDNDISATTDYDGQIVAAVQCDNIFGLQFHPERSQSKGMRLLGNFIEYVNQSYKGDAPC
tara:strand:- start:129 stop:779 length:651 start_codon:yes stop_codon:yes gene_type:complete